MSDLQPTTKAAGGLFAEYRATFQPRRIQKRTAKIIAGGGVEAPT